MAHLKHQKDGSASVTRFSIRLQAVPSRVVQNEVLRHKRQLGLMNVEYEPIGDSAANCWVTIPGDVSVESVRTELVRIFNPTE
ncbi:MAG: hypothetical protein ACHQTE_01060 [Candidatus Saccharimonadales bacterium]